MYTIDEDIYGTIRELIYENGPEATVREERLTISCQM